MRQRPELFGGKAHAQHCTRGPTLWQGIYWTDSCVLVMLLFVIVAGVIENFKTLQLPGDHGSSSAKKEHSPAVIIAKGQLLPCMVHRNSSGPPQMDFFKLISALCKRPLCSRHGKYLPRRLDSFSHWLVTQKPLFLKKQLVIRQTPHFALYFWFLL